MELKEANDRIAQLTLRLTEADQNLKAANLHSDVLKGQLADANHALTQVTMNFIVDKGGLGMRF